MLTPEDKKDIAELVLQGLACATAAQQPLPAPQLTEEELLWVRLAIEAEARKIRFRDAVIEKSLAGLVWSGILGIGYIFIDFLKNHGLKIGG